VAKQTYVDLLLNHVPLVTHVLGTATKSRDGGGMTHSLIALPESLLPCLLCFFLVVFCLEEVSIFSNVVFPSFLFSFLRFEFPFNFRAEKLWFKRNLYDVIIVINYNTNPIIKKKGSAIFLHIAKKNYAPTKGCIAISKKDIIYLVGKINSKTRLHIY
jgi:hypothetical protein